MAEETLGRGPRLLMGQGVTLRRFGRADLEYVRRWYDDETFRTLIGATAPLSEAEAQDWFARADADPARLWYAIVRDADDSVIGEAGLLRMFPEWRTSDASIMIGEKQARGRGHGSEAGRLILDLAFDYLGLHRLAIGVVGFNEGALRFWERLGFKREGVQRDGYLVDGVFYDFVMMSPLEDEWRQRRGLAAGG